MGFDITSANATAILLVDGIYPAGIVLQQFGTDSALSMDAITIAETRKGVDGRMVAGYLPSIYVLTVTLEASSPSVEALSTVWQLSNTTRQPYICTLECTVPSIGKSYVWSTGTMKSGTPFPSMQKVLAPTTWVFDFQDFIQAPI